MNIPDDMINMMTQRIVREVHPEKILLFGSRARGKAHSHSDLDLLVVERELFGETRSPRREAVRIWRCLSELRVPIDILVYSAGEAAQWKDSHHHVIGDTFREGKACTSPVDRTHFPYSFATSCRAKISTTSSNSPRLTKRLIAHVQSTFGAG